MFASFFSKLEDTTEEIPTEPNNEQPDQADTDSVPEDGHVNSNIQVTINGVPATVALDEEKQSETLPDNTEITEEQSIYEEVELDEELSDIEIETGNIEAELKFQTGILACYNYCKNNNITTLSEREQKFFGCTQNVQSLNTTQHIVLLIDMCNNNVAKLSELSTKTKDESKLTNINTLIKTNNHIAESIKEITKVKV